jgi:5'-3' exonuclease
MKKRIILVDGFNLFIRCFNIIPITNDDGEHFGGVFGSLRSLRHIVETFKPNELVFVWDGPKSGLKRKQILKEYKGTRNKEWKRGSIKAYDFLDEQEEKDNFNYQINRLKEYIDNLPFKTSSIPYIEADDVIAYYAKLSEKLGNETIIYSTDGDYKQLVSENTVIYHPMMKKNIGPKYIMEKHGVIPENFIFIKCLIGDKSDNISGIKGLGEKTILKLFPRLSEEPYEDIDEFIFEAVHIVNSGTKGYTKAQINKYKLIVENKELLKTNYKLMQLIDPDISVDSKDIIRFMYDDKPNKFNRHRLRMMFLEDKLATQIKNFEYWQMAFSGLQFFYYMGENFKNKEVNDE